MDTHLLFLLFVFLIVCIVVISYMSKKEYFDFLFPPSTPPTAYELLNKPIITSENNPTIKDNTVPRTFYTDNYVCATPSNVRPFGPDDCAQYGIGEQVMGPMGLQRCVCVAKLKEEVNNDEKPTADNVVIDINGVCTKNEQCSTNHCTNVIGYFSKVCKCPTNEHGEEQQWDEINNKCIPFPKPPEIPKELCVTNGKFVNLNSECSLGEALTPTGFCACQLVYPGSLNEGKFMIGANCTNSSQCMNNLVCGPDVLEPTNNVCKIPNEKLDLTWSVTKNMYASCPDSTKVWDNNQQKCVKPNRVESTLCKNSFNTSGVKYCSTNIDCSVGEICNPSTQTCYCNSNIHSKKIEQGGLCEENSQCLSNNCLYINNVKYCS